MVTAELIPGVGIVYTYPSPEAHAQELARTCSLEELWQIGEFTGRLYQQQPTHALERQCADVWQAILLLTK